MIIRTAPKTRSKKTSGPKASVPKRTFADLLKRLGDVDPQRVRLDIWPGRVTDEDCTESKDRFGCLCEMVDGVLVEKVMGWDEGRVAFELARMIGDYLDDHPLGVVIGPDGPIRVETRVIRMPDVSFISWERTGGEELPEGPVMEVVPDLAVEVISRSNRPGEMQVKCRSILPAECVWCGISISRSEPREPSRLWIHSLTLRPPTLWTDSMCFRDFASSSRRFLIGLFPSNRRRSGGSSHRRHAA